MIHQIIFSFRILFKQRLYTGINLMGLGIAIASFWFIMNFVKNAHQYDAFHQNHDRIYRFTMEVISGGGTEHYAATGKPLGSFLSGNYSGISAYARMTFYRNVVVKVKNELFNEKGFFSVNSEVLDVFSFDFITGNSTICFSNPKSLILSRSLAEKYFNTVDVVDQSLTIDETSYTITGVFEDWPENSHLEVNALFFTEVSASGIEPQDWFDLEHYNYVLLDPLSSGQDLSDRLELLKEEQLSPILEGEGFEVKLHAQPLDELYFETALTDDVPKGNLMYVNAIALAGLLVFLISGVNYINLSLTQSAKRLKETELKKALGMSVRSLWVQSAIESFFMTLLVLFISGGLVFTFGHLYFQYTGFHAVHFTGSWLLLLIVFCITFLLGLTGTSYAGVHFSFSNVMLSNKPIRVNSFKKWLLGFQLVITSIIMIATITVYKQINFMKDKDLGFSKEQILILNHPGSEGVKETAIEFREQLGKLATIENASLIGGGALPGEENGKELFHFSIDGSKEQKVYNFYRVDENYCALLDLKFVSGRNFQAGRLRDKNNTVIINESLAKSLNWESPLGKTIWYGEQERKVIGVVQDFHNQSLHEVIEPVVLMYDENYPSKLLVKSSSPDVEILKKLWQDFFPDSPFSLTYFDQFLDTQYAKEAHMAKLLGFFSIISLLLCCMGLFAIFSLNMLQKKKEMSIRKVLGANSLHLIKASTKDYYIIILLAISIAIPIAWIFMDNWLSEFSYKIRMDPLIFFFSTALILMGTSLTLMYYVVKALYINPVDSLKCE